MTGQERGFGRRGAPVHSANVQAAPAGGIGNFRAGRSQENDEAFRERTRALLGDVSAMLRSGVGDEATARGGAQGTVTRSLLLAYIGPSEPYYTGVVDRMGASDENYGTLTMSWIWGAFFFPLHWLVFRKLWLHAAGLFIVMLLNVVLFFLNPILSGNISLALNLMVAVFGKSLYVSQGAKRLRREMAHAGKLSLADAGRLGGVSVQALVILILLSIVAVLGVIFLAVSGLLVVALSYR